MAARWGRPALDLAAQKEVRDLYAALHLPTNGRAPPPWNRSRWGVHIFSAAVCDRWFHPRFRSGERTRRPWFRSEFRYDEVAARWPSRAL